MAKGNVRGYSKDKEAGRQLAQRLLPKYNSPTYLRLKKKVAAKNPDDLIDVCVDSICDLIELDHKTYPFLHPFRKLGEFVGHSIEIKFSDS